MINSNIDISWESPILPSKSLAGIQIGLENEVFQQYLKKYLVNSGKKLYKFNKSPLLILDQYVLNENGDGYYHFILSDPALTRRKNLTQLQDSFYTRALNIIISNYHIFSIKTWAFEILENEGQKPNFAYRGRTKDGLGLYSPVAKFLGYSEIEFDEGEALFYTDNSYGNLEITGYGQTLEDSPNQIVMAMAVF